MTVPVGLQLFSVRESLARDAWGTLARLAEAGFTHLEAANHNALNDPGVGFGVAAPKLRSQLASLGLSIVGCHINPLELDILPRALDYQAELGNNQFGCDIEFFPYGDRDYVMRRADLFNQIGKLARERPVPLVVRDACDDPDSEQCSGQRNERRRDPPPPGVPDRPAQGAPGVEEVALEPVQAVTGARPPRLRLGQRDAPVQSVRAAVEAFPLLGREREAPASRLRQRSGTAQEASERQQRRALER